MKPYYQDDDCACGCGAPPAKGRRFISGHNLRTIEKTDAHRQRIAEGQRRAWETKRTRMPLGSTRLDANGYRLVKVREGGGRWDKEHVIVAESAIGRRLLDGEHVHHINGVKTDNRPENLHVMTKSEHGSAHRSLDSLLPELIGEGVLVFDRSEGVYRIA